MMDMIWIWLLDYTHIIAKTDETVQDIELLEMTESGDEGEVVVHDTEVFYSSFVTAWFGQVHNMLDLQQLCDL